MNTTESKNAVVTTEPTVFVVDDDAGSRNAVRQLVGTVGLVARTFRTAEEFLDAHLADEPGCLIADVRLPGMSGLDLQQRLTEDGLTLPVILMSGYGELRTAVDAIRAGAVDFLEKPVSPQGLLDDVRLALDIDRRARVDRDRERALQRRLERLTPREREVVDLVVAGHTSARIAYLLELSPKTVHYHRAEAMGKLGTGSVAELTSLVLRARGAASDPTP